MHRPNSNPRPLPAVSRCALSRWAPSRRLRWHGPTPRARSPSCSSSPARPAWRFQCSKELPSLENGLALVRVASTFAARVSAIHLMAAEPPGFTTAPLMRRMRNRALDLPLGGQADRLVSLAGAGTLALAPPAGERLVVFEMEGELLFVRETILVGFAASLTYENGRLAAFEGEAAVLVQLRGHGGVVLRADGELAATQVRAESGVVLARDAILGWAGRLIPRELSGDESPAGVKGLVSFSGEGWVLSATRLRGPASATQTKAVW